MMLSLLARAAPTLYPGKRGGAGLCSFFLSMGPAAQPERGRLCSQEGCHAGSPHIDKVFTRCIPTPAFVVTFHCHTIDCVCPTVSGREPKSV